MQTIVKKVNSAAVTADEVAEAGRILREGGLVIFPTETVYGLGGNALSADAAAKIYAAKGRPSDNPLIVHVTEIAEIAPLVREFPEGAAALFERFSPGPLTVVMPKSERVPSAVSGGLDTVAIRIPSHPVARAFIKAAGVPVAAPSANRSGRPSPTAASHLAEMMGRVDYLLDGGACSVGVESTVISLCGTPRLLRPGAVSAEQLREIFPDLIIDKAVEGQISDSDRASSPGMKYRHYAPETPVYLLPPHTDIALLQKAAADYAARGEKPVVFCFEEHLPLFSDYACYSLGTAGDYREAARRIFALLREADGKGDVILAEVPDKSGVGLAVYNRMLKAAGHQFLSGETL